MINKKIFILLPDGGGIRNFVYSSFNSLGVSKNWNITYWNGSEYPINERFGYNELIIDDDSVHPLTPIYSRARKRIELNIFKEEFQDEVYESYKFPLNFSGLKNTLKSLFILLLIYLNQTRRGLNRIKKSIDRFERGTKKYQLCKQQLELYKPDLVFCTNQRNTKAIAPLLAAKDLGIKTICFVQSWDNVPKAMQVLETDYYFVWSELMKTEVLKYYPLIKERQVFVTGTPQFEPHYDKNLILKRNIFFNQYGLDSSKKYICFSGDDKTTSPLDQYYLEDLCIAIQKLNKKDYNLGVLFRRCPADFSDRYDTIIEKFKDIVVTIDPIWNNYHNSELRYPEQDDYKLLSNICEHAEMVTNVCSSTVFDFVAHKKSCIYYNYEQPQLSRGVRDIGQNYNYVHFRSMPNKNAVLFCTNKKELEGQIEKVLNGSLSNVKEGMKWYEIVVGKTPSESSLIIWNSINKLLK